MKKITGNYRKIITISRKGFHFYEKNPFFMVSFFRVW
jgi:hypothetical protein